MHCSPHDNPIPDVKDTVSEPEELLYYWQFSGKYGIISIGEYGGDPSIYQQLRGIFNYAFNVAGV